MSVTLTDSKHEYMFAVSGEDPIRGGHGADGVDFVPETIKIITQGGFDPTIFVFGPVIKNGKTQKRRGAASFYHDETMPEFVRAALKEIKR